MLDDEFPFLDVGMFQIIDRSLSFRTFKKLLKQVNYISSVSNHEKSIVKAITLNELELLAKLTILNEFNSKKLMSELYPIHALAI